MDDHEALKWTTVAIICVASFFIGLSFGASIMKHSFLQGKFCPECGAHYSDADLYCTKDGTELLIISGDQ